MRKCLVILFLFFNLIVSGANYHFADDGDDGADGSIATPYKSITKANSIWASAAIGDSIVFKRGDIFYGTLIAGKSGTLGSRIIIGAYGTGVDPIITGFTTLASWTNEGGGIYSKAVTPESAPNVLTFDGVNTHKGKEPDTGWWYFESHSGNTSITDNDLSEPPDYTGGQVVISTYPWFLERKTIIDHVTTTLTFSATSGTLSNGSGYIVQDDMDCLDQLGEWYYTGGTLYMYFGAELPTDHVVKVSTLDKNVNITAFNYITFDNITFEGSNAYGFYLYYGKYITIQNCKIQFSGANAIDGAYYSEYITINADSILYSNNYAIEFYDVTVDNTTITSNYIAETGRLPGHIPTNASATGIAILGGESTISYNKIINTGYNAIHFRGNNCTVNYNLVNSAGLTKDDGAGIYTSGVYTGGGYTGCTIKNNVVLNCGVGGSTGVNPLSVRTMHGIYLDDNSEQIVVDSNIVANNSYSGIYLHNSKTNTIGHNIAYNNARNGIYYAHEPGFNYIENNTVNNNQFICKASGQTAFYFKNLVLYNGGYKDTGNNNYYARPIDDDDVMYFYPDIVGFGSYMTLTEWKTYSGQEAASAGSPIPSVADTTEIDFYYNFTGAPVVQPVTDMIDMAATKYAANYTIPPYYGVVLLEDPAPGAPPHEPYVSTSVFIRAPSMQATGGGNCTDDGGGTGVTAKGVCWNSTGSPTITDSHTHDGTGEGAFTSTITGLAPATTYYIRAYATNEVGTGYGYIVTYTIGSIVTSGGKVVTSGGKVVIN